MRLVKMGHLEKKKGIWWVRMTVPPNHRPAMPAPYTGKTRMLESLKTKDKAKAIRLAPEIIAKFQKILDRAAGRQPIGYHPMTAAILAPNGLTVPQVLYSDETESAQWYAEREIQLRRELAEIASKTGSTVPGAPLDMLTVIETWAKRENKEKKTVEDRTTKAKVFIGYLDHSDMQRVARKHCIGWLNSMVDGITLGPKGKPLSRPSIDNYRAEMNALFNYAVDHIEDGLEINPWSKVKFDRGERNTRPDFTDEERRKILTMARDASPVIRWSNWLSVFHGFQNAEIADATTHDVECIKGIWVLRIREDNRADGQTLKTEPRKRTIPLHSAVLAEGFISYVESLPAGPLFPQITKLDSYGRRAGKMTEAVDTWLKKTVGTEKTFYSHRHSYETFLRSASAAVHKPCNTDFERYLFGHAGGIHDRYGDWLIPDLRAAVECAVENPLA
jgi:hypothetical protein